MSAFVYVVGFSNGRVKVGYTETPMRRLTEHRADARRFGIDVVDVWVSPEHWGARLNERLLIRGCSEIASEGMGEYFSMSFSTAVEIASALDFDGDEPQRTQGALHELVQRIWRETNDADQAAFDEVSRWEIPPNGSDLNVSMGRIGDEAAVALIDDDGPVAVLRPADAIGLARALNIAAVRAVSSG